MTKLLIGAGVIAIYSLAPAAPMCASGPLSNFLNLNADGCMLGTSTVSSFAISPPITGADAIPPGSVAVTVNLSNTNPGLAFSTTAAVGPNELFQLLLSYKISGSLFTGDSISLTPGTITGDAAITAIQDYCLGRSFVSTPPNFPGPCPGGQDGSLLVLNAGSDSATFAAVNLIDIVHDLTLDGGTNGSAAGATVTNQFVASPVGPSQIPEPSSSLLFASGLAVAGIVRQLKMKRII